MPHFSNFWRCGGRTPPIDNPLAGKEKRFIGANGGSLVGPQLHKGRNDIVHRFVVFVLVEPVELDHGIDPLAIGAGADASRKCGTCKYELVAGNVHIEQLSSALNLIKNPTFSGV